MSRFNRNFLLTIQAPGTTVVVEPPRRIVFTLDKSSAGGLNKLNLQVYNLRESNRLAIVKDAEQNLRMPLELRVGYDSKIETVFKGTVHRGSNDRDGSDFISSFDCLDGGYDYLTSYTSKTVQGKDVAVNQLIADMPNTSIGRITEQATLTRPKVLVGNPVQLIRRNLAPDETFYIDNEQVFIIKKNEVVSGYVPIVNARTGLIASPQKENQKVTFETLLNPALKLGGRCNLQSTVAPYLNGIYKIESMSYTYDHEGSPPTQRVTCIEASGFRVL